MLVLFYFTVDIEIIILRVLQYIMNTKCKNCGNKDCKY